MSLYGTPPDDPGPQDLGTPQQAPVPRCSTCGSEDLEPGFVEDGGESSHGYSRWIPGPLERGIFGGAARMGKPRFEIVALMCRRCRHLELFVGGQV
ncbi:hypothetical protein [Serinibacter arcticus]|uniref:hypothetical protein n=1 Tax=Serinibacter arcticus TaxID=1655435 RepID=UPI0018EEA667|nr:hypothetical protein [Serinibacter arcticus]